MILCQLQVIIPSRLSAHYETERSYDFVTQTPMKADNVTRQLYPLCACTTDVDFRRVHLMYQSVLDVDVYISEHMQSETRKKIDCGSLVQEQILGGL